MDELLEYFETVELTSEPVKINNYITVIEKGGKGFIDGCRRRHELGDTNGVRYLQEYKAAIEAMRQPSATAGQ